MDFGRVHLRGNGFLGYGSHRPDLGRVSQRNRIPAQPAGSVARRAGGLDGTRLPLWSVIPKERLSDPVMPSDGGVSASRLRDRSRKQSSAGAPCPRD